MRTHHFIRTPPAPLPSYITPVEGIRKQQCLRKTAARIARAAES